MDYLAAASTLDPSEAAAIMARGSALTRAGGAHLASAPLCRGGTVRVGGCRHCTAVAAGRVRVSEIRQPFRVWARVSQ